ncbi:MAG TPA: CHAD domain-containing protein [Solirubrobacteraceae bacterium]|nr:CHAD domain-containing protein [Solirubrobacteraceae bacterium]
MDSANNLVARAQAFVAGADKPDRSYRLHADEHVPDGIRRIARGQLVDGHEELSGAPQRKLGSAVHETRKRLKRLRTLVRLSRDALGEETYQRENVAFRVTGRRLSASRDAHVLLETLDALRERFGDELPERVTATLRARLQVERDHAQAALRGDGSATTTVLGALTDAVARTPAWTFEDADFGALSPGLRRIYARGRKRLRAARKDPSPENLHEWRKRVKDLRYALQVVREAHPDRLGKLAKRAKALGDALGDAHDLHVLRDYAEAHPQCFDDETSRRALLAVVDRRSAALCDKALRRGRKLYERSPKAFVRKVARGWRKRAASRPEPQAG